MEIAMKLDHRMVRSRFQELRHCADLTAPSGTPGLDCGHLVNQLESDYGALLQAFRIAQGQVRELAAKVKADE